VFALTIEAGGAHALYHYDGIAWTRVRTPLPEYGSGASELWSGSRITYLGGFTVDTVGVVSPHLHALARTTAW
jgi:hypothetical protein